MRTDGRRRFAWRKRNEGCEQAGAAARAEAASLRSRGTTENRGADQTQHERKSLPAIAARFEGSEGCGGRAVAALSEPNGATVARATGGVAWLSPGKCHCREWFG